MNKKQCSLLQGAIMQSIEKKSAVQTPTTQRIVKLPKNKLV